MLLAHFIDKNGGACQEGWWHYVIVQIGSDRWVTMYFRPVTYEPGERVVKLLFNPYFSQHCFFTKWIRGIKDIVNKIDSGIISFYDMTLLVFQ